MSYYNLISLMPKTAGIDPDAQAFITAAGITDPTQKSAINTLVVDLKGYSLWTKFKAIYPIVGGTASTHKFNLKDPRDLDAAFRLTFASGWTHSLNGMTPTNSYADSKLIATTGTVLSQNSVHLSFYSRTNSAVNFIMDISASDSFYLGGYYGPSVPGMINNINVNGFAGSTSVPDSLGFFLASRTASTTTKTFRNLSLIKTDTRASSAITASTVRIGYTASGTDYSNRQYAFASIGDGLTDTEAANFYTAVQAFQTTLGRSIGTQTVSDPDAQAFINAAVIDDQVQANAINNLVIGMKADGLWTKMKAIYPIVGGTASSHAVNLKTPGTYNLSFASGWTHSSTGMLPNGATFANTNLNDNTILSLNSVHISYYSRTNENVAVIEMGTGLSDGLFIEARTANVSYYRVHSTTLLTHADTDSRAFYVANRTASNVMNAWKNGVKLATSTGASTSKQNFNIYLGALNNGGTASYPTGKQCAFASIGDGLTDTDAANYYTTVNAYQVALSRNV